MNRKQLRRKSLGTVVRLRPCPTSLTWSAYPRILPERYNAWRIEAVRDKPREVELSNPHLGYRFNLGQDHIRRHVSPDILELGSQVVVEGRKVHVEPLNKQSMPSPQGSAALPPYAVIPPSRESNAQSGALWSFFFGMLVGIALTTDML